MSHFNQSIMNRQESQSANSKEAQRINYLIKAYLHHSITIEEHDELDAWVGTNDENMRAFEEMTSKNENAKEEGRKKYSGIWFIPRYRPLKYSI
jgi:hypothetical protein